TPCRPRSGSGCKPGSRRVPSMPGAGSRVGTERTPVPASRGPGVDSVDQRVSISGRSRCRPEERGRRVPDETVADTGEFGLIARVTRGRIQPAHTLLGPGDDAAVVAAPDGRVVISTDVLVERVHFRLDWSTPAQVGRKAAAVNLADVAAMGAVPTGLLVGLGCPPGTAASVAEGLADGLWE